MTSEAETDALRPEADLWRGNASRPRRPRIGLVMDHPRRDLPGAVLVALELVRTSATAVIVPAQMSWIDGSFAELDAIVVNHARRSTMAVIEWLARRGQSVFVLDDEGYISSEQHRRLLAAIAHLDAGRFLKGYFVWGEASGSALAEADPRLADRILATGAPRFDLFSPRLRGLLRFERQGYVLLNPNFNGVNPYHGDPKRVRRDMGRNGWEPEYLDRFLAELRDAYTRFLTLCAELPRRLPHRQFVLRPHPFEAPEPYARAVAGLANVHINTEGDVSPVLAHASHLVHLNCNTSVEARLLGLRPIQTAFLNSELLREHMPLYSGVSVLAQDLDDLCRLIEDEDLLARRDDASGVFEEWIRPSFHSCDGYAARRVAEAVLARSTPRSKGAGTAPPASALRRLKFASGGLLGTLAIQILRRQVQRDRRVKAFSTADVRALVEAFSAHLGQPVPPVRRRRSPWTALPMGAIEIG